MDWKALLSIANKEFLELWIRPIAISRAIC
jgi:hypothetical protein